METISISKDYLQAVAVLKEAIMRGRYRAAQHVNREVLALNYGIGKFISINSRNANWGTNAIAVISKLLQKELPGIKGYSEGSMKMMRRFFEEWHNIFENRQSPIDDFQKQLISSELACKIDIRQMTSDEIPPEDLKCFFNVGFTIHYHILTKTTTLEERMFYIRRCAKEFWTVEQAKYHLSEDLYHKEGTIRQTNFDKTIDEPAFKQKALQSFKDEYMLDFINIEDPWELPHTIPRGAYHKIFARHCQTWKN